MAAWTVVVDTQVIYFEDRANKIGWQMRYASVKERKISMIQRFSPEQLEEWYCHQPRQGKLWEEQGCRVQSMLSVRYLLDTATSEFNWLSDLREAT